MARLLIVGCGCRGRELARALVAEGHAVRGTTRDPANAAAIAAAGAEPYVGDPDRVSTLMDALTGVSFVCWLLGQAAGEPEALAQLRGPRLEFLLAKLVDTGVRGYLHEPSGDGDRAIVRAAGDAWRIPVAFIEPTPQPWPAPALSAWEALLDSPPNDENPIGIQEDDRSG